MTMPTHKPLSGTRLRSTVNRGITPMVGIYDVFSAATAARHYDGLFLSGYGFAASHYGLPDLGFITWTDMLGYLERVRAILPNHHLLVDIDDGYGDPEIVAHVVRRMEQAGASGIVLEDQQRPRRCGHFDGKQPLGLPQYMEKLRAVLDTRRTLFIVARTDTKDPVEIERRVVAFSEAGADAVLAEALPDLAMFRRLKDKISVPLVCNQLAGGNTPPWSQAELASAGVGIIIYSTPCLFAAHGAIDTTLIRLKESGGKITPADGEPTLPLNAAGLMENLRASTAHHNGRFHTIRRGTSRGATRKKHGPLKR